jgi:hypothetical protein
LFLGCVVARQLWFALLSPIGLTAVMLERDEDLGVWWLRQ